MTDDDLDVAFKPIVDALVEFSKQHNLLFDKRSHEAPLWCLCFAHPKGGHAKFDLTQEAENSVKIVAVWWLDDYRRFTRNLKRAGAIVCPLDPAELKKTLEWLLMIVLGWQLDDWTQIATGYEKSWSPYTQEQFEAMAPRWPVAR